MRVLYTTAAVLVLTLSATTAYADGLFYQLPKDGTWAKYDLAVTAEAMGKTMQAKGSLRMASVGQTTEEGQPCRWIEMAFQMRRETPEGTKEWGDEVWKVLVPEKYLAKGESPLDHAIRGWTNKSVAGKTGKARQMKDVKNIDEAPMPMFLAGPPKDVKQLRKAEVESKLGKLSCEGIRGLLEFKYRNMTMRVTLENRLHPKAPFGVVSSRLTLQEGSDATAKPEGSMKMGWDFKLADFGEGAASQLPDAK